MQERLDYVLASDAWSTLKLAGGNATPEELMPRWDAREERRTPRQSTDDLIAFMRALQTDQRRRKG